MNKKFRMKAFIFFLFVLLLTACSSSEDETTENSSVNSKSSEKQIEIIMGTPHSTSHHAHKNVYTPWVDLVEEKTNGKAFVSYHPNGTLGKPANTMTDAGSGVYDVGIVALGYEFDSTLFPYTVLTLPFAFPDIDVAKKVIDKYVQGHQDDVNLDKVISLGGFTPTDPYIIQSTKPIKTVEDVKGMKIFVPGDTVAEIVKGWGATPVSLATEELYQSLERGVIDAAVNSAANSVSWKVHEVAPYIVDISISNNPVSMVMNKTLYDSLPDDVKKIFDNELIDFMPNAFFESYHKEIDRAMNEFKESGAEISKLSPEEYAKFMKPAKGVWDAWVEEANQKGYDGNQLMSDFIETLESEGVVIPFEM
ncbi:TRAP transporter substrate-binding protein [Bacillus dakarensis]|uniref:TRAP transporter substrate-binding protein n=1 Tax=Robertmurraya dakarensis TaxID=1926278 RepID=UPI0009813E4A|nr:TRAP transporter substrate-binding protein DctP [Bacillus dakarensis]